jgi:L-amino acid N-acyltransferase
MAPTAPNVHLVHCNPARHSSAILAILNEAIVNSTAVYDYQPRPLASMESWFEAKLKSHFPVLGLENESGELLGFATYGTFRNWPAYKYTVEHSIYVHHAWRGRGLGQQLLSALLRVAEERDVHVLVAGIDAANHGSIRLHEKFGFEAVGIVRQCGFKFGRWLDLAFYQRILPTPASPSGER